MRANRIISTVALNPFLVEARKYRASCYYRVSCGDWQGNGQFWLARNMYPFGLPYFLLPDNIHPYHMIIDALCKIANHRASLTREESRTVMGELLAGKATDAQVAALLVACI